MVSSGKYHRNTIKVWVVKRRGNCTLAQKTTPWDVPNKSWHAWGELLPPRWAGPWASADPQQHPPPWGTHRPPRWLLPNGGRFWGSRDVLGAEH